MTCDGGVTSLLLRLDLAARDGFDPDDPSAADCAGRDGLMAYCVDDFDAALSGVHLTDGRRRAGRRRGIFAGRRDVGGAVATAQVSPDQARGAFNADPSGRAGPRGPIARFTRRCR